MIRSRIAGYSFLELLIAVILFSIAMVGFAAVFQSQYRAIGRSRSMLLAQYLAKETMEKCLAARFNNVVYYHSGMASPPGSPPLTPPVDVEFDIRGNKITQTFYTEVEVDSNLASSPVPALHPDARAVRVTVSWREVGGIAGDPDSAYKSVTYRTYISRTM